MSRRLPVEVVGEPGALLVSLLGKNRHGRATTERSESLSGHDDEKVSVGGGKTKEEGVVGPKWKADSEE
jgi:hypothetical protein